MCAFEPSLLHSQLQVVQHEATGPSIERQSNANCCGLDR